MGFFGWWRKKLTNVKEMGNRASEGGLALRKWLKAEICLSFGNLKKPKKESEFESPFEMLD